MKLSKSGATLANDSINGMTAVTYGGVLDVFTSGDPLAAGDSFQLFNAAIYGGSFTATNLPSLGTNLFWDTSTLTNGTLTVASGNPSGPPLQPASSSFSSFNRFPNGTCQMTFIGTH